MARASTRTLWDTQPLGMSAPPPSRLSAWARAALGIDVALELIPGGGSRTSYVAKAADGSRHLLRVDNGAGPLSGTEFTIEREYRVISALRRTDFPVPAVLAYDAAQNAMLMEFVEGATSYQIEVSPELQRAIQSDLMRHVVALHTLKPRDLGLEDFARTASVGAALEHDLARLKSMYAPAGILKEPEIDFALRWLRDHIPDPSQPARIVHGDVGPGNFIFGPDGRLRAIIDWEVVHMGHPLEDLGAVLCRSLGVPFGHAAEHIANYEAFSGAHVERDALAYGVILVLTRWYIGLNLAVSRPSLSQNLPVLLTYRQSVADALVRALAERHRLAELSVGNLPDAVPERYLHDYMLHALEQVVTPALGDPYVRDRAQGLAKLSRYLRDHAAYGAERLQREEIEDAERLTGRRFADHAAARAALCEVAQNAAGSDIPNVIGCLQRINQRRQLVWRAAMGPMADRRLRY
jgi:aminoglycoside phosphotransferase (APT) family kinase protein